MDIIWMIGMIISRKGVSDTSTGNGVSTHRRFSDDDDVDDHDSERCDQCDERLPALSTRAL